MHHWVIVPALSDPEGSTFKDNCVKTNKHRPILSAAKCRSMTLGSGNRPIDHFVDNRSHFSENYCRQAIGMVGAGVVNG